MKFSHVVRVINLVSPELRKGGLSDKTNAFLSKISTLSDEEIERALRIRESGVANLFSLAAKGKFDKIAEILGLDEPPKSYAEALKIISEKKKLSELYRM